MSKARYFAFEVAPSLTCGLLSAENNTDVTLLTGAPIDPGEVELPFRFTITSKRPLQMNDYYEESVVSARLLEVLRGIGGVDALQAFPAEIVEAGTGQVIRSYSVVNFLGMGTLRAGALAPPCSGARLFLFGAGPAIDEAGAESIRAQGFRNLEVVALP